MEKIKLSDVIVVEGKYDKIKLSSFVDAVILTTGGFGVFNSREKSALIKKLSEKKKIIILTDSDGAGFVIRNKIKNIIGDNSRIINLYIPQISGKEHRKNKASKEGTLGVEGMETETLKKLFSDAGLLSKCDDRTKHTYTKSEIYALGLSGKSDSAAKRAEILKRHALPDDMSANAFLDAVNILGIDLDSKTK